jgi:GTPase SAR1 family protein
MVPIKRAKEQNRTRDNLIAEYTIYSSLANLCMQNSKPFMLYGDIGSGKTYLVEKLLNNKYNFIKMQNTEPHNNLHRNISTQSPFIKSKFGETTRTSRRSKYIYFVDDFNVSFSMSNSAPTSQNFELLRQINETQSVFSTEDDSLMLLSEVNFITTCTIPSNFCSYFTEINT